MKNRQLLRCALISFITAFLSLIYFVAAGRGILTIVADFNLQQLPFAACVNNMLKSSPLGEWCWNLDLGASFIGGFGFSNLGNPFYWLSLPFPADAFPYMTAWLYMLKYTVAAVCAYLYLRLFVKDERNALLGALLYAFSGFQTTNLMFYNFHDAVALFPLLLLGFEKAMEDRGKTPFFVLSIFINCLLNYFFFVGEVIFLVIYFFFRTWSEGKESFIRKALLCIGCGALGVGMAAALFIPCIISSMGNERSGFGFSISQLLPDIKRALYIFKGLLLPGDVMHAQSAVYTQDWSSCGAWLPMVGAAPVIAYVMKKRDRLGGLLLLLLVMSLSPILNSAFTGFTLQYERWWYMPTLLMALVSAKVFDDMEGYRLDRAAIINAILAGALCLALYFIREEGESLVFLTGRFAVFAGLSLAGCFALYLTVRIKPLRKLLLVGIMGFSVLSTMLTLRWYREGVDAAAFLEQYELGTQLKQYDSLYRYNSVENELMLTGETGGIGCFSSTIEVTSRNFDRLHGAYGENMNGYRFNNKSYAKLLGGKYSIVTDLYEGDKLIDEYHVNDSTYYITEQAACPIGFKTDSFISREKLMEVYWLDRPPVLMHAVVLEEDDCERLRGTVNELASGSLDLSLNVDEHVKTAVAGAVENFRRDSRGFGCTAATDGKELIFFSVPYSAGWTAKIDGEETEILNACGMMALFPDEGEHDISFSYRTPGFRIGIAIAAVSWLVFAGLTLFIRKRKN